MHGSGSNNFYDLTEKSTHENYVVVTVPPSSDTSIVPVLRSRAKIGSSFLAKVKEPGILNQVQTKHGVGKSN